MLEKLGECPICKCEDSEKVLLTKDFVVSKEAFKIVKCKNCSFNYTNPRPQEGYIAQYYQSIEYISHQDNNAGLINKVYYLVKKIALQNKLKLINSIHTKGTILDIGCGTGSFLETCKNDKWIVQGVEPDEKARNKATEKIKSEIKSELNSYQLNQEINVITMWHVLEHIHQLNQTLEKIRDILKNDGKLVIAVPNVNSYDANVFKEYWAAYDLPRHLYHFSKGTLVRLLKSYHFKLEKIEPMKFDSFYISLLSNKYKTNKTSYWSAAKTGYLSNKWAEKNDNNYSSLTYIFSK